MWIFLGLILIGLIVLAILFRWDWLRGPLARHISARLHRPVAITGHLYVHPWSLTPQATVTGLVIGNAPWAGQAPLATLPKVTVRVRILPLLQGKTILPLVEADQPRVDMLRDVEGRANWDFDPNKKYKKPLVLPAINQLIIRNGALSFRDEKRHLNFAGVVSSSEEVGGAGKGHFVFDGRGTLNNARFVAHVGGGPLAHVDPSKPYFFKASVEAGPTRATVDGRIDHPFDFGGISGRMTLTGPDLADVYEVTGVPLPNTPPYQLASGFSRQGDVFALRRLNGRVGQSDLSGSITVSKPRGRRLLEANLASRHLRLADLVAVVGGVPKKARASELSPMQRAESAKLTAEHRMLPDAPLDPTRLRAMDARLTYRATQIDAGRFPLHDLSIHGVLDHGRLDIDPLTADFAQGRLTGGVAVDARGRVPKESLDLRVSGVALQTLVHSRSGHPPIEGSLFAHAKLAGTGGSVRAAAAHANGSVSIAVPGGYVRQSFAELAGIDLTKSFLLLITKNKQDTPLRCAVADFHARDGVLQATSLVADTGVVQITGSGTVDLRDERMNLRFDGKPKKFRLVRLDAPITLSGSWQKPKPGVDVAAAAPQVLGSIALGVLVSPAAVLLPFIAPGLAKNADCQGLLAGQTAPAKR